MSLNAATFPPQSNHLPRRGINTAPASADKASAFYSKNMETLLLGESTRRASGLLRSTVYTTILLLSPCPPIRLLQLANFIYAYVPYVPLLRQVSASKSCTISRTRATCRAQLISSHFTTFIILVQHCNVIQFLITPSPPPLLPRPQYQLSNSTSLCFYLTVTNQISQPRYKEIKIKTALITILYI